MKRAALALLAVTAVACGRCGGCGEAPGVAKPIVARPLPPKEAVWEPVPPAVEQAMKLRANDPRRAIELLETAWANAVDAGDLRSAGMAMHRSGDVSNDLLEFRAAHTYYLRALGFYELGGQTELLGRVTNDLGLLARVSGDDPVPWFRYSSDARRDAGDVRGLRVSLGNLGARMLLHGPPLLSVPVLEEALELSRATGDLEGERKAHINLAGAWLMAAEDKATPAWSLDAGPGPRSNAFDHLRRAQELGARLGMDAYRAACEGLVVDARSMCLELSGHADEATEEEDVDDGG